jgi:hypothetical protein
MTKIKLLLFALLAFQFVSAQQKKAPAKDAVVFIQDIYV